MTGRLFYRTRYLTFVAKVSDQRNAGKHPPVVYSLREACYHGMNAQVHEALKQGANPDAVDETTGANLLHTACWRGYSGIVRLLLEHGAKPDGTGMYQGYTPLHVACRYGQAEIVEILLDHGADGTRIDHEGKTPLDYTQDIQDVKLSDHAATRAAILEIFRERCPEAVFTAFCTMEMKL